MECNVNPKLTARVLECLECHCLTELVVCIVTITHNFYPSWFTYDDVRPAKASNDILLRIRSWLLGRVSER